MSVTVPVQDGQIVDGTASQDSLAGASKSRDSSLDKEAFLQLLVAQMKYQDPLEPTSNTEYISQLATFSSLEEMQNLRASMEASQAASLVGKTVIVRVSSSTGESSYVTGYVDYVKTEGGRIYLSIDDNLYSLDDLDSVVDDDYMQAVALGEDFQKTMDSFPDASELTLDDKERLGSVALAYDNLSDYLKNYLEKYYPDCVQKLNELVERMNELVAAAGEDEDAEGGEGDSEGDTAGDVEGEGGEGAGGAETEKPAES